MKKLYMFMAASIAAISMNAQPLHMTIQGEEVANNSRIDITSFFHYDEDFGEYKIDPKLHLISDENGEVTVTVTLNSQEVEPALDSEWIYGASMALSFCAFDGTCPIIGVGESVVKSTNLVAGQSADTALEFMGTLGERQNVDDVALSAECTVKSVFKGETYTLTLFVNKTAAGVDGLAASGNLPARYYDLQGREVQNPASGLYIVRRGNQVSKTILK